MCCLQEKSSGLTAAGRSDTLLLRQRGVVSPAMSTCWLKSLALPANMRNETFGITPKVFFILGGDFYIDCNRVAGFRTYIPHGIGRQRCAGAGQIKMGVIWKDGTSVAYTDTIEK